MSTLDRLVTQSVRLRSVAAAAVAGGVLSLSALSGAQGITPPTVPHAIAPPSGNFAFLLGRAAGTQGYVCLPSSPGASTASWTVNAARPEATLLDHYADAEIGTHFLSPNTNPNDAALKPLPFGSPTWQSWFDGSRVWGQRVASITAGSDESCPNSGSIDCLLLRASGAETGPSGGKLLTRTTYILRLNTKGGISPNTGCSVPGDVGKQALVPYTADYYFFRADE